MVQNPRPDVDIEPIEGSFVQPMAGRMDLEATDHYFRKARADAHRAKARSANWVALILVLGLVLSLPLHAVTVSAQQSEVAATQIERIFTRWYDVMAPLVGMVVGALFGLTLSDKRREDQV